METTRKDLLKPHYVELIYKTSIKSTDRIRINDAGDVYLLAKEILEDSGKFTHICPLPSTLK